MAKIKFGMMMTDARGKLGGQVFSKNRAGAYIRSKVTPVNPQTSAQGVVRSNLAVLSSGWNYLTPEQIAEWNNSVEKWATTDIFGDIKRPTGKNLFVKLNLNLLNSVQPTINTPPAKMDLPALASTYVEIDQTTEEISIIALPVFTTGYYQIEACAPVPRGVNFVKNKFRVITYEQVPTSAPVTVGMAYIARFGSFANAENIFFRIRAIGENGQAGTPIILKAAFV